MKKVSKVKAVNTGFNSWEKDGTTYYPHRYNMEDGTEITANHKAMNPFKPGDEVEYEIKGNDNQGNPKGSVGKPNAQGNASSSAPRQQSPEVQDAILYQTCLKIASEVLVAQNGITHAVKPGDVNDYALALAKQAKSNITTLKDA